MLRLLVALALLSGWSLPTQAQDCGSGVADARRLQGTEYVLVFRTRPAKIVVGQHFVVEMWLCPEAGGAGPRSVMVDAFMPEHRHGMNYKPTIKALEAGRFEAEGLMFHMPGRWEFRFDVERQGRSERLTSSFVLR